MNGDGFFGRRGSLVRRREKIARKAFDEAYQRQCAAILAKAKKMLAAAFVSSDLWTVHDYLSVQRRTTVKIYDYR